MKPCWVPFSKRTQERRTVVYALRWGGKVYVGSSRNLQSRLYWWAYFFERNEVGVVEFCLLKITSAIDRGADERNLISKLGSLAPAGHNKTRSGVGGYDQLDEAARAKVSMGLRASDKSAAYWHTKKGVPLPEATAAAKKANTGRPKSPEHRAKIAEGNRRRYARVLASGRL